MGESSGGTGETRNSETGALPEGASLAEGSAAGGAQRVGVPPFRGQFESATNLSLLADLDEPEELMIELWRLASEKQNRSPSHAWTIVAGHAYRAMTELQKANQPRAAVTD